ncbi:MAG: SPOR domain-containing protein [Chitinophagales bacterium]|nr:SPOR domain-containing protein [Chitinophagales bacterium]
MKKTLITITILFSLFKGTFAAFLLHNDYSYLQEITFELYTDEVPAYKVPEQIKSVEETLMFEVLHATWKDKHWVAYTLNKNLLGTFKVGQPSLMDNSNTKKIFFVAAFPGSVGGLDLYTAEYSNGVWGKPKNLGKAINTTNNESNPGLLNDHTLTYSSGGIIKKLDLNTLKVVDLEETNVSDKKITETISNNTEKKKDQEIVSAIGDNSTAAPTGNTSPTTNDYGAIGDNSTAAPASTEFEGKGMMKNQTRTSNDQIVVQEKINKEVVQQTPKAPQNTTVANVNVQAQTPASTQNFNVQSLGVQSRDAMLAKYKAAIQLGAFSAPKWEQIEPLSKYGKIVTYKNDNGVNVVWIVGFANRAAAEAVLPQVKATTGFENAYVTGK